MPRKSNTVSECSFDTRGAGVDVTRAPRTDAYRSAGRRWRAIAWAAVALGVIGVSGTAHALPGDLATKFRVNDDDPMTSIPTVEQRNADPLEFAYYLQDMIARGELAFKERNWARAIKYYEPLAKAVPDRAITFSRLCMSYSELGNIESAVNACSSAVHREGALVIDHFRFVNLVLKKPEISARDVAEVDASLAHLRAHVASQSQGKAAAEVKPAPEAAPAVTAQPVPAASSSAAAAKPSREEILKKFLQRQADRALGQVEEKPGDGKRSSGASKVNLEVETEVLACKAAVRLRNAERMDRCLTTVRGLKLHPSMLLPFEWTHALVEKDEKRATVLLEEARKAGLPAATLAEMATEQRKALAGAGFFGFFARRGVVGMAGLVLLALLTFVAVRLTGAVKRSKPETLSSAS